MIDAKIIADSFHNRTGTRLTTFEVTFPRWVLAEFNTHRQLSRNSASSRAIPIEANIRNILADTAVPVSWGKNQAGMVADEDVSDEVAQEALAIWLDVRDSAIERALELKELGIHKQIANRLIENFTYQKVIVTATEWDNFFWLRNHKDAQPEIRVLAKLMLEAYTNNTPKSLGVDDWHTPYYGEGFWDAGNTDVLLEDALKISASCCAQVSYRKSDDSIDKANTVFNMLNLDVDDNSDIRMHSSPVEHQATPIDFDKEALDKGISHFDIEGCPWSGNFKDFIQYRKTFNNECHKEMSC